MKKFRSVALDKEGRKYAGSFEAENEAAALAMLHGQGFEVISLEEIPETEVEVENTGAIKARAKIEKKSSAPPTNEVTRAGFSMRGGGLGAGFWKTLGIAAAVLGGIPLLVYVFMPRPPLNTPEEAASAYFKYEIAGDYAAQYDLFSTGRLMLTGSRETYTDKRAADAKRLRPALAQAEQEDTDDALAKTSDAVPYLAGVEKKSGDETEAEVAAFIIRSSIHEEYAVKLLLEKRLWKIRDVKFVKRKELGRKSKEEEPESPQDAKTETPALREAPPKTTDYLSAEAQEKGAPPEEPKAKTGDKKAPPGPAAKAIVSKAQEQALGLIEEARDRGVIDEKEFQARKKQLGFK